MPVYACRVADARGRVGEVLREAPSEDSCLRSLADGPGSVVAIREVPAAALARRRPRCPPRALEDLTATLALLLQAGLTLRDALEAASAVFPDGAAGTLVTLLRDRLARGAALSEALASSASGIPSLYAGLVRVGERVGSLERTFALLAAHLRRERGLRERLAAALVYPAVVLAVAVAVAVFVAVVVVPRLQELLAALGPTAGPGPLPLAGLSRGLAVAAVALGALAALGTAVAVARRRGGRVADVVDGLLLVVPPVATYARRRAVLGFVVAMESLTAAGIGVEAALAEAAGAAGNRALAREALAVRGRLLAGGRLSAAFTASPLFPALIGRWAAIGERTGRVDRVFAELRAVCEQEVQAWIDRLAALVEPVLALGLGVVVAAFAALVVLPIFSLFGAAF